MATIKLDISEYELMQENKRLLENSLKNEQELHEKIKQLTQEKIDALETAKMKVVKIRKTEITEHLLQKKDDRSTWEEIFHLIGIRGINPPCISMDYLRGAFFSKATSYSTPTEEITTHGLDEIKLEIRNELKEQLDDEIASKIKIADMQISQNNELINSNTQLKTDNDILTQNNKLLVEQCNVLTKTLNEVTNHAETLDKIKEILKNGYGRWNKSQLLDNIIICTFQ
jgi:hypothetical protein